MKSSSRLRFHALVGTAHLCRVSILGLWLAAWIAAGAVDLDPTYVGRWPGTPVREIRSMAASRDHVFLACGEAGLLLPDSADPSKPHLIAEVPSLADLGDGSAFSSVAVSGTQVFAIDGSQLVAFDFRDPAPPARVGAAIIDSTSSSSSLAIAGTHAYVPLPGSGIHVFEVPHPASPKPLASYPLETSGMTVAGDRGYLASGSLGLEIFDLSPETGPRRLGVIDPGGSAQAVAVSGNLACVASAGVWTGDAQVNA